MIVELTNVINLIMITTTEQNYRFKCSYVVYYVTLFS